VDEFVEDLLTREYMADGLHGDMQQSKGILSYLIQKERNWSSGNNWWYRIK